MDPTTRPAASTLFASFPDHTAHLVAISMTPDGWPQAIFTLNLWGIGDAYESAGNLRRYVRRFHLAEQVGPPPLVRLVNVIFETFGRLIERLQNEKIAMLAGHRAAHPDHDLDVFEDRLLEILSGVEVEARARRRRRLDDLPLLKRRKA